MKAIKLLFGAIILTMMVPAMVNAVENPHGKITIKGVRPADFNHDTHLVFDLKCGVCHHKSQHVPYTDEEVTSQATSNALRCKFCHNDDFANENLRSIKEVMHKQCKSCHQVGIDGAKGPTRCIGCHKADTRTTPDDTVKKHKK